MSDYTLGPWSVCGLDKVTVRDRLSYRVADCGFRVGEEMSRANARLIAAAPELLDALQLFLRQWNACGPNSDFGRYFQNVRDAGLTAISKATGETP